jgi:hypothetical protein
MRRAFAIVLLGLIGCLFPSLDGLTGDAAMPSDTSTADVRNDVDVAETSTDAGADVRAPFCAAYTDAGASVFCEDFDSIGDAGVLGPSISTGVIVALNTSDYTSPPASLFVTIPAADASAVFHGAVSHATSFTATTSTLDFDIKVASVGTATANVAELDVANRELLIAVLNGGLFVEEDAPPPDGGAGMLFNHPTIAFAWDSMWHHIHFVLSLSSKTTTLAIDGTPRESDYPLAGNWIVASVTLVYGVSYTPNGPWTIGQDNVLLQLAP